jgi:hypothetical protein
MLQHVTLLYAAVSHSCCPWLQALAHWSGTNVLTARNHATNKASDLQQLVQPGAVQRAPAELLQAAAEVEVAPSGAMQAKMQRKNYTW